MTTTDWEARYQCGDTPWDKGAPHPALVAVPPAWPPGGGRVLVPGCGGGHDCHFLAAGLAGAAVLGVDVAPTAVAAARARCAGQPGVRIALGDVLDPDWKPDGGPVDLWWEHTLFCAILPARRADYAAAAARWVRPGGWLEGIFFTGLDDRGDGPPWNTPVGLLAAIFEAAFEIEWTQAVTNTHPGREGTESRVGMRRR